MKLFDRVECEGFYKKIYDGIWIHLDKKELKAYKMNSALCGDAIEEEDVEYVEKIYYEHRFRNFSGVIVGFTNLVVKGYLDVNYEDAVDVGLGIIPEKFYVSKRPKEVVECAIVYYANNKKHYVPLYDIKSEIIDKEIPRPIIPKHCKKCIYDDCNDCHKYANRCPNCDSILDRDSGEEFKHCPDCGQALIW